MLWITSSRFAPDIFAQFNLRSMPPDEIATLMATPDQAAKLAEQGDRSALTRLAWMYEAGRGEPRNLDEPPGASRQRPKRVTPRPSTPWR